MPRTSRIGGPATRSPGMSSRRSMNAAFFDALMSVESDGGKTVRPLRSRSSLAGKPGMKRIGLFAMLDFNPSLDSTPNEKIALHFDEARVERANQIVGDAVGDRLVKCALIAIRPEVQLQRLELDAFFIGNVADADRGEVRLPGHRADAGELRRFEVDLVVAFGAW